MPQLRNAAPATIHASALLVEGQGVLVRGASGSGKSSLVLALLLADRARNRLVADDRVVLTEIGGRLHAAPPAELAGMLEVRGQGILRQDHVPSAEIVLVVDLEPPADCTRFPAEADGSTLIAGVPVRRIHLPIGQSDGWMRVLAALLFRAADV